VFSEAGMMDGRMADLPESASPTDAQMALLASVEEWTGRRYRATWTSGKPGSWSAELQPLDDEPAGQ
jgi:predicted hotdog family 3-hydroxylacyl-ACP dehydratase